MMPEVPKVRLGELIEECDERNRDNALTLENVRGISIEKKFIPTKADMAGVSLTPYKIVKTHWFCYVPVTSRNGGRISLAIYNEPTPAIVSSSYSVFRSRNEEILLPEYLFLLFNRAEFDRYSRYNSWGSARETFDFSEMCRVKIPLPDIKVQRDLVAIYDGLQKIIADNEELISQMEAVCHDFVVDCQSKYPKVKIGEWIEEVNKRNYKCEYHGDRLYGISSSGEFIKSIADQTHLDLSKYKIVSKNEFCYTLRIIIGSIALYKEELPCIVSTSYPVFRIKENMHDSILPEYLNLIFRRKEFHRYAEFNSWGSAKDNFSLDDLGNYQIPLPPLKIQKSITNISMCLQNSKQIVADARELMKNICPALVQKAAHSA